jgi:hypothetical protein
MEMSVENIAERNIDTQEQNGVAYEGPVSQEDFGNSEILYEAKQSNLIPEDVNPTGEELNSVNELLESVKVDEFEQNAEVVEKKSLFGRIVEGGLGLFGKEKSLDMDEKQSLLGKIQEQTPLFKDCQNWKEAYGWWVKNFPKMYGELLASEVYVAGVVLTFAPHVIPLGRGVIAPIFLHIGYKHSSFIRNIVDPKVHAIIQKYKYPKSEVKK